MAPLIALLPLLSQSLAQFPPPQRGEITEATKCDWGTVVAVSSTEHPTLVIQSSAGLVTYQVSSDTPVLGADHTEHGTVATLKPGTRVRIYFVVDKENGARATEVNLEE